jgi:hypothetical protein
MIVDWKSAPSLDLVVQDAISKCQASAQFNLILAYELPIDVLSSEFVAVHRPQAQKWLSDPPPRDLPFSHAQFYRGNRGTDYVLGQLERRKMGRRAILAMLDMDTVLDSAHRSVPAFSLLQFAIDANALYVTAYFRALEVGVFLPSNLTEIAIHCESIHRRFTHIAVIRLFILAFRGYYEPDFPCLEKLPIDAQAPGIIAVAVADHQYEKLRTWLNDKHRVESVVQMQGIEEMLTAVRAAAKPYPAAFGLALERAVESLRAFGDLRDLLNEGSRVEQARQRFDQDLTDALNALPR